mgnify:CR=1 FL=1
MSGGIPISQLDSTVSAVLEEYSSEVYAATCRAVDTTAKAADREIRRHITFRDRTGDYRRAFSMRKTGNKGTSTYMKTWYVKDPHWRLTHLLENGHKNRDGSWTRGYPHIVYGDKLAQGMLQEEIEKEMGR